MTQAATTVSTSHFSLLYLYRVIIDIIIAVGFSLNCLLFDYSAKCFHRNSWLCGNISIIHLFCEPRTVLESSVGFPEIKVTSVFVFQW